MTQIKYDPRPSPISGSWYPASEARLRQDLSHYLGQSLPNPKVENIIGILVPHAGFVYSGATAGAAFSRLQGCNPDTVVVLSPYHQYSQASYMSSGHSHYKTPLGEIPIDANLLAKLNDEMRSKMDQELVLMRNDPEHSLEIELPFLQMVLPNLFGILPIMVREHNLRSLQELANCIHTILAGQNALVVISTDLSHFYPLATANHLDARMLDAMATLQPEKVEELAQKGQGEACGLGAVLLGMILCKLAGAKQLQVIKHDTSATASGDTQSVVGYGSAIITT